MPGREQPEAAGAMLTFRSVAVTMTTTTAPLPPASFWEALFSVKRAPARQPLLRSAAFPWVGRRIASVSTASPGKGDQDGGNALPDAIRAIRQARVGGAFWAPPCEYAFSSAVVRAGTRADLEARLDHLDGLKIARSGPVIANLPNRSWARDAGPGLAGKGISVAFGERDPWSLLRFGTMLLAAPGDEWILIAALAGAETPGVAAEDVERALADALIRDVAYRDPFTGLPSDIFATIGRLREWRRICDANRRIAAAGGIAWWKRQAVGRFLWTGRSTPLTFSDRSDRLTAVAGKTKGGIAVWPSRAPEGLGRSAEDANVPLVAVEDGFIRSVGLGSNLHPPLSIVVDEGGIYYDPNSGSDLQRFLASADFPPALLARAGALRRAIVAGGISKYASGGPAPAVPPRKPGRLVLVAGQVEDDMSVRTGGGAIRGNLDLLARARAAEPEAFILFRPHPDVDAGHRVGRIEDTEALRYADEVARAVPMHVLLANVDAVHVLTSLTGFEALLRGLEVTTHGQPFFAGWGLTRDMAGPIEGRGRQLPLDALVAATLILYPRYLDPVTRLPCPPEVLLDRLAAGYQPRIGPIVRARQWQGKLAKALRTTTT